MKTIIIASSALLLLAGSSSAIAQDSELLSPLAGRSDNGLIDQVKSHNSGSLCALVKDGTARLMSFGRQAVVDVDGKPAVLSYHPARHGNEVRFTGPGITVSGDLVRQSVTDMGKVISHDVSVRVVAGRRSERLEASWNCQDALPTVSVIH